MMRYNDARNITNYQICVTFAENMRRHLSVIRPVIASPEVSPGPSTAAISTLVIVWLPCAYDATPHPARETGSCQLTGIGETVQSHSHSSRRMTQNVFKEKHSSSSIANQ